MKLSERIDFTISRRLPVLSRKLNVAVFRVSNGRLGGRKRGVPIGLLSVPGRRSGEMRTVHLMYLKDGERYLVVASNGGADRPPGWYLNLTAAENAQWRTGDCRVEVTGETLSSSERERVWGRMTSHNPLWAAFQDCTRRETPVIALTTPSR